MGCCLGMKEFASVGIIKKACKSALPSVREGISGAMKEEYVNSETRKVERRYRERKDRVEVVGLVRDDQG